MFSVLALDDKGVAVTEHTFTVVIHYEEGQYVAQCLEVNVASFGATYDEARRMITEALELRYEGEDEPFPEQLKEPTLTTVDVQIDQ